MPHLQQSDDDDDDADTESLARRPQAEVGTPKMEAVTPQAEAGTPRAAYTGLRLPPKGNPSLIHFLGLRLTACSGTIQLFATPAAPAYHVKVFCVALLIAASFSFRIRYHRFTFTMFNLRMQFKKKSRSKYLPISPFPV